MRLTFSVLLAFAIGVIGATWTLAQEHPAPTTDAQPPAAAQNAQQVVPQPSHAAQTEPQHAQKAQPQQQTADQEHAAGRRHSADPNFRYYNNHWWYWQNDAWLMWNGSRWLNQQERRGAYAPRRSFSYTDDAQGFVPTEAGIPQSSGSGLRRSTVGPGTVEYQRVIPSFGRRSAGAKVLGNY